MGKSFGRTKAEYHLFACIASAMMTALAVVLERILAINTQVVKIGFSFAPIVMIALLFGPIYAALTAGLADLIGALLLPTGTFFPGFTITAVLVGLCYGLFLQRAFDKKHRFLRILIPTLINNFVFGLTVNTLLISLYFSDKGFWPLFVLRLSTQYAFLIPMNLILIPVLMRVAKLLYPKIGGAVA